MPGKEPNSLHCLLQEPCSQFFSLDSQQWYLLQVASAGLQTCDRELAVLNCSEFLHQTYTNFYCKLIHWDFRKSYNLIDLRDFFWQFAEYGIFHRSNIESVSLSNPICHCTKIKGDTVSGEKLLYSYSLNWAMIKVVYWFISNMVLTNIHQCKCCWAITPEDAHLPALRCGSPHVAPWSVTHPTCRSAEDHSLAGVCSISHGQGLWCCKAFWQCEARTGTSLFLISPGP